MVVQFQSTGSLHNANFPKDDEGRVYHLAVKRGEVANRIVSVGSPTRAEDLSKNLENPYIVVAKRGFVVYTGTRNGVPLSIIATGMGFPMMDFVLREARAVVDGPMIVIRLGTCGTIHPEYKVGSVVVATKGSISVLRDPDAFDVDQQEKIPCYRMSKPIKPDTELSSKLVDCLNETVTSGQVLEGMNATADSFYSSQGRQDSNFDDRNESLIDDISAKYPEIATLEMETFHLFDLARCSRGTIRGAAATIVLAQRKTNDFLDNVSIKRLELEAGKGVLNAICQFPLDESSLMSGPECVWNSKK